MRNHVSMLLAGAAVLLMTSAANAQDPAEVDPDHYTVEFENDYVRVLRISYGPHESSVMHEHPAGVAVIMTDHQVWNMTHPDGEATEASGEAGDVIWDEGTVHSPQNVTDNQADVILIELKADHDDDDYEAEDAGDEEVDEGGAAESGDQ